MSRLIYNLYLNEACYSDRWVIELNKGYEIKADLELALFGINYTDFTYVKGNKIKVKNLKKIKAHVRRTCKLSIFKKVLRYLYKLNRRMLKVKYIIIANI